eukprot:m.283108 g.283108  ORF g.283108 m.283108 type:complete len:154 (-) comp11117_c1_seq3:4148-4609(-)
MPPATSKGKRANGKTPLETIESLGPKSAAELQKHGIHTMEELLEAGRTKTGRKTLAGKLSGITEHQILQWCNRADLMRIKGVGEEWSDLLEAAGVDTVQELKHRKAENLHAKMVEIAATAHGSQPGAVKRVPALKQVKKFISRAKLLKRGMEY